MTVNLQAAAAPEGASLSELDPSDLSLTMQLERALEHLIFSGEIAPGERLNEIDLSRRFGTSRGPLRESMQALQARGVVEVVRNKGVFVRKIGLEEAMELYDVRAAAFGLAGRLLTAKIDDQMLAAMQAYLRQMDHHIAAQDNEEYYRVNLEFHRFLLKQTGNSALIETYQGIVNKLHLCRVKNLVQQGALAISNREHREMVEAVASGDERRAQDAFFRHVERSKLRFRASFAF